MDGFASSDDASPHLEPVLGSGLESTLELRILDGPQRGARAAVETGIPFVVGALRHDDDAAASCDIVLNQPGAMDALDSPSAVRARVTIDRRDALLEVLDGEIELDGRRHAAGKPVAWPIHVPIKLGAATIAFGRANMERWPASGAAERDPALGAALDAERNGAHRATPAWAKALARRAPLSRRPEIWLAATGAALLLSCTGSLLAAHRIAAPPPADPKPLTALLHNDGFRSVSATADVDGRIELHGRVTTQADRSHLDEWLTQHHVQPPPRFDVQVDEEVLRDVVEVFRVNGIPVQAQVAAPGHVEAQAAERDVDRLARAEEVVRRDVHGLEELNVSNTVPAEEPAPPPVVDDPNKRIASLVPAPASGGPGYIVTADGARYFVGALLPSGYRIAQIEAQRLRLERDGHQSTLNF
jgi:type III secretion protein D